MSGIICDESMKAAIKNSLGTQKNQILYATVADLYFTSPDPNNWTLYKTGVLAFVRDRLKDNSFFFTLLDLDGYNPLWTYEIDNNFNYKSIRRNFHSFDAYGAVILFFFF